MEVKINWKGEEKIVVVKKLKHKDMKAIMQESIKTIKWLGGEIPNIEIDFSKYQTALVKYGIEKAPFELTDENIDELDAEDFQKIVNAIQECNPFLRSE